MCPYRTEIAQLSLVIRRFRKASFIVVAYDFNPSVFKQADLALLPQLIEAVTRDIQGVIKYYKAEGMREVGFMASSLGGFITYNVLAHIPDFNWGVFNTAGNVWLGVWEFPELREAYIERGYQLADLEKAWAEVQFPTFEHDLTGNYYLFLGSSRDKVAPLQRIESDIARLTQAGATTVIEKRLPLGHNATIGWGLFAAFRDVKRVRRRWQQNKLTTPR